MMEGTPTSRLLTRPTVVRVVQSTEDPNKLGDLVRYAVDISHLSEPEAMEANQLLGAYDKFCTDSRHYLNEGNNLPIQALATEWALDLRLELSRRLANSGTDSIVESI